MEFNKNYLELMEIKQPEHYKMLMNPIEEIQEINNQIKELRNRIRNIKTKKILTPAYPSTDLSHPTYPPSPPNDNQSMFDSIDGERPLVYTQIYSNFSLLK